MKVTLRVSAIASSAQVAGRRTSRSASARMWSVIGTASGKGEEGLLQAAFAGAQLADGDARADQRRVHLGRAVGRDRQVQAVAGDPDGVRAEQVAGPGRGGVQGSGDQPQRAVAAQLGDRALGDQLGRSR
nr:hypothetical protein GCM10020092_030730 [Actinoplanes digitatis]